MQEKIIGKCSQSDDNSSTSTKSRELCQTVSVPQDGLADTNQQETDTGVDVTVAMAESHLRRRRRRRRRRSSSRRRRSSSRRQRRSRSRRRRSSSRRYRRRPNLLQIVDGDENNHGDAETSDAVSRLKTRRYFSSRRGANEDEDNEATDDGSSTSSSSDVIVRITGARGGSCASRGKMRIRSKSCKISRKRKSSCHSKKKCSKSRTAKRMNK